MAKKPISKDYARTPEQGRDYKEFIEFVSDEQMMRHGKFKHSEFKNSNADNYETMDTEFNFPPYIVPPWWPPDDPPPPLPPPGPPGPTPPTPTLDVTKCRGTKLNYTTTQLGANEQTTLTASGSDAANGMFDEEYLSWTLNGIGHLAPTNGKAVIYTAPGANPGCNKALITLYCAGIKVSSVAISVNTYTGSPNDIVGRKVWGSPPIGDCGQTLAVDDVYCNNTETNKLRQSCGCNMSAGICKYANAVDCTLENQFTACATGVPYYCSFCPGMLNGATHIGYNDQRTAEQITAGCCPDHLS